MPALFAGGTCDDAGRTGRFARRSTASRRSSFFLTNPNRLNNFLDQGIWLPVVAVERGALSAADIQAITRQEPGYLSPVNVAEIQFGLDLLPSGSHKQRATAMLRRLRRKPQLRITVETAETFGRLAAKLRKTGRDQSVRVNDLWLAAQAIQRGFRLLTSNSKDFADIPGLKLVVLQSP